MIFKEFNLPKIAFIDGQDHNGNHLKNRNVVIHIPTTTIVEIIADVDFVLKSIKTFNLSFKYKNHMNIIEYHTMALHKSNANQNNLETIFNEIWEWYSEYLTWEDQNILLENKTKLN